MPVGKFFFRSYQIGRHDGIEDISSKVYLKVKRSFPNEVKMLVKPVERYMDVRRDHSLDEDETFFSDFDSFLVSGFDELSGFSFFSALSLVSFRPLSA